MRLPPDAVLLTVDVQRGWDDSRWGARNNPACESNVAALHAAWRAAGRLLWHVRHASTDPGSPLSPGQSGHDFKPEAAPRPGEPVLTKSAHSAFVGTGLEALLAAGGLRTLVLCGIQTNHCVATTARMAGDLGLRTLVAGDACATFDQPMGDGAKAPAQLAHDLALAELSGEYAEVVSTAALVAAARAPPAPLSLPPRSPRE